MNVGEDRRDGTAFTAGKLGAPRARVEMLENELIHAVVDRVGFLHGLAQIERGCGSWPGHAISSWQEGYREGAAWASGRVESKWV